MNEKNIIRLALIATLLYVTITIIAIFNYPFALNLSNAAQIISGFSGSLFALCSGLFIYVTIKNQNKQFKRTEEQFELSRELSEKQQFENIFFQRLGILNDIINNTKGETTDSYLKRIVNSSGYEFFSNLFKEFKNLPTPLPKPLLNHFKSNWNNGEYKNIHDEEIPFLFSINANNINLAVLRYEYFFEEHSSQLGHFYRYIHNLIKYAIDERSKYKDEKKYIDLIQTQVSNDQLGLLFYNGLSKYAKSKMGHPKFKDRLDKYQLFENISSKTLIINDHHHSYPMTIFKFLTHAEKMEQKKIRDEKIKSTELF